MFRDSATFNKTDTIGIIDQNSSQLDNLTGEVNGDSQKREHLYNTSRYDQNDGSYLGMNLQLRKSSLDNQKRQARIVSLEHTIEGLQNELKSVKEEQRKKDSQLAQFENNLADLTKQLTQRTTEISEKKSRIAELARELSKKDQTLSEKNIAGINLKEMTEQTLKATADKVEQLDSKVKKQRAKRRELAKINKELEMKLNVTKDELTIARSQVLDLQAIRKQGTDGLMSEYSENLALRERM
jgi:chromosome segregation ATPase